ncbi:DNA topoisomerase IV subunit A [Levilactobacillus brevis]|uniref:DNA topoisomerase 4 subunit A n=2 Tax=Levilactobacillus brevis TaxID=1580 RepID=Q03S74_LEVBA|nr:DNA topoisomerase IV subunit A [Levilactobacillus brevis]ABJ63948.1 DNA topoisomerase IV subunit A [Levilactobacillus brevis ATCC 367]ARW50825.1 DNA topoisomerase 4 subunit [Levilactobacillus brevis]MBU5273883.1 DNA topoisomerase IV subunit A [Levilactobacillus brevis]MBX6947554.1 DNA topoisomerase IV subunit A [Levilactobacillus brevis]MCB4356678.1 DNA topoisomerase IV subunit A [Levilactobacillus brevis]
MSEGQKIQELTLEEVMGDRFGRYSKSIIQERALPDIRDGLKPVQRRILFAMNKDGNTYDKGFRKSAKSVGNVMGNFHPHGDSSIYEALTRMSQDWKVREPLVEMHGNNGSMDGDPAAAMRYTEARLSKLAGEMLRDIDKDTVEMVLNFDDTEYEPTVLPARFPNLLVNGATGISAGYATEIPPHNLGEVVDALIYLLSHPKATLEELMSFVQGPDFPTGGIIQGKDGIVKAYETGRGRIVVRSKTAIEPLRGNKSQITVTEIPYEVNKAQLVKKIDEIRLNKKVEGLAEVRDETDRDGLRIAIELKRDADAQGVLNYLFKNTELQITYNFNMVAINHQRPEHVGLKTILSAYLEHQRNVITKRTEYNLQKALDRQHIVVGLIKALSILDQVIKTIRASKDRRDARDNLVEAYDFSEKQADAIVALQLYRLTNTDVTQLEAESAKLSAEIEQDHKILAEPKTLNSVLRQELKAVAKDYRNPRRTEIQNEIEDLKIKTTVTVADEDVVVLVSHDGYLKRSGVRSYTASDPTDNGLKDGDYPIFMQKLSTLNHLMMFTSKGNLIYRPVHEISDVKWKETGEHISQTIGLAADEEIVATFAFKTLKEPGRFLIATSDGYIKQTAFADLTPGRTYKSRAAVYEKLKTAEARVVAVKYLTEPVEQGILLISKNGYALRYPVDEVSVNGARTTGVRSMDLRDDDEVVNLALVTDNETIALITQRGAFKRLAMKELSVTSRARRGVIVLRELKRDPHRIVDFMTIPAGNPPLEIMTSRERTHDVMPTDHPLSGRYSNGSFVIDTDVEGQPLQLRVKPAELVLD